MGKNVPCHDAPAKGIRLAKEPQKEQLWNTIVKL